MSDNFVRTAFALQIEENPFSCDWVVLQEEVEEAIVGLDTSGTARLFNDVTHENLGVESTAPDW
jgi:hypothetical protein